MSTRHWLKALAAETKTSLKLDGNYRLETRHTIYVFQDAVCVDVARRGCEDGSHPEATIVGMRVVGWLLDIEGHRKLMDRWFPGARAVLWRAASPGVAPKIALTSSSSGFSQSLADDSGAWDDMTTADYTPFSPTPASSESFARLFPQ